MCGIKMDAESHVPILTQKELTIGDVRSKLGMVYYKQGNLEKALDIFEKTLQTNPRDAEAIRMRDMIKSKLFEVSED
jgi:Tfp pilus assembly protein PilF